MSKILIICTNVFGYNGIAAVILNEYKAFDKKKMQIDLLCINEPSEEIKEMLEKNNSKLYIVERNSSPLKYMKNIKKIMKENAYDVVHIHGNSATMAVELMAAKKAGVKVRIPHCHNTTSDHMKVHKLLKPFFNKYYTHGFACGTNAGKWLYGDKEFVVINNGIDTTRFTYNKEYRNEIRKEYNVEDKFVVGHVGVFNYQKNHEKLIEIFDKLNKENGNSVLMLIGEGENKEKIEALVKEKELDEQVIFIGTTDDVHKYMNAFDVIALPSRFEGLPVVLIEAQCTGLHCVASKAVPVEADVTGLVEFADCEDGVDAFVNAINQFNVNDVDRECVAVESSKTIELKGYSIWDIGSRIQQLYENYIEESK
ncbi:MAG: glycosyltransferase family 1 protein [Lachnospiraceae bacterium]|nr:glycosyltransferase family 1 protein [Lachnospiraceae bacterium]